MLKGRSSFILILGLVLCMQAVAQEFSESLTRIFDPLGMRSSSWNIDKENQAPLATLYFPAGKQVPAYRLSPIRNADSRIGRIILTNVNAEDNETLWKQYRGIHDILAQYENKLIDP
jgi:CubicO group peptidase (beta-lactamase class C family)